MTTSTSSTGRTEVTGWAVRCAVALLLAVGAATVSTPAVHAADGLTATATPDEGKPGTVVQVVGANWEPHASLQVVTCGDLAIGGSSTCDLAATYTMIADDKGAFSTVVKLGKPPKPCPCVLHVSTTDSTAAVDIPVVVTGHPTATPPTPDVSALPAISVASAQLVGWGPWLSLFGTGPVRDLVLTVHNNSDAEITNPQLVVRSGTPDEPGDVLLTAQIQSLPPHAATVVTQSVTLPAGVGGPRSVFGTINSQAQFTAETTSYAWGFYVLDVLLLLLLVWVIVRRVRHRGAASPQPGRHGAAPEAPRTGRRHKTTTPPDGGHHASPVGPAEDSPVPFPVDR